MMDYELSKDSIVMVLMNTGQNKMALGDMPHRPFHDLSISYRLVVEKGPNRIASTIISWELANSMGMKEEELYEVAVENTRRIFPPTVHSMLEAIMGMMENGEQSEELEEIRRNETPIEQRMYVISNESRLHGAASMLYEEELHKLAEKLESSLYIMPSSIHEVIAISANIGRVDILTKMVKEVNASQVAFEEQLSNQVYLYNKDLRTLSPAMEDAASDHAWPIGRLQSKPTKQG
ncbi:DUF5688 family protein [Lachnospiraceae bacterium ZAX-1]